MADYVHPEVLVTTQWVSEHLRDPQVRIVESDEDLAAVQSGAHPRGGPHRTGRTTCRMR